VGKLPWYAPLKSSSFFNLIFCGGGKTENEQRQKQIPFGNDNQKGKGNCDSS
jgi:hypothetical protein